MNSFVKVLLALIAFAVLGWFCVYRHAPLIQADVRSGVQANLAANLGEQLDVAVSGRDVTLTGEVDSEGTVERLLASAAAASGVRTVVNQLTVVAVPTTTPYRAQIDRSAVSLRVSGELPDDPTRTRILEQLGAFDAQLPIADETALRDSPPAGFSAALNAGIEALAIFDTGSLSVTDNQLELRGQVASAVLRDQVRDAIGAIDGIESSLAISVAEPPAIAEQVQSCQARFDTLLAGEKILFATSSADIDASSQQLLTTLAEVAAQCPNVKIEIAGHTDSRGDPAYNQYLSQERANSVRDALVALGVRTDRLSAVGFGADQPRDDNATSAGRENNRRIELTVSRTEAN